MPRASITYISPDWKDAAGVVPSLDLKVNVMALRGRRDDVILKFNVFFSSIAPVFHRSPVRAEALCWVTAAIEVCRVASH